MLNILTNHSVHAETRIEATSSIYVCCVYYSGSNFIPDASTSSHVTGVELGLTTTGAIYTLNILGNGYTGSAIPNGGCSSLSGTTTLIVGANEYVTMIEAWRNSDSMWYRLRLTLNTGAKPEYDSTPGTGTDTLYTFKIPVGKEFTGFYVDGG